MHAGSGSVLELKIAMTQVCSQMCLHASRLATQAKLRPDTLTSDFGVRSVIETSTAQFIEIADNCRSAANNRQK